MHIAIKKYANSLPVWLYRWVLCFALLAFMPGKAAVITEVALPEVHPAQHGLLAIEKIDQSHGQCREYVKHPRKHHQIARRRQSSPILVRDIDHASEVASLVSIGDLHKVQGYSYDTYLRPSYYVFLFRYALF